VEAAITNCLSPGDRVVVVRGGKFGERMAEIAQAYGAVVTPLDVEPGAAAEPDAACRALTGSGASALLFVHNETSTGVTQDAQALAEVARDCGALVICDAVSSMGGLPIQTDGWGLDVVASGSQKAFMLPPGLGFVSMSARAWEASARARMPRLYFDLTAARAALAKGQTAYTPNVNMIAALEVVLGMLLAEGMDAVCARHARMGRACRAAVGAMGLDLLARAGCASDVVTAARMPEGMDSRALTKAIRERHRIIISGGQGDLQGRIFRIAHLGACTMDDLARTIEAVAVELGRLGHACSAEAAVAAAEGA
jgi:aspartate aminotransferase-like enzyme